MTTLLQFRTSLRTQLVNTTTWTDAMLNDWVNQAIYEYSRYFPRNYAQTHIAGDDASGAARTFTLNDAAKGISRVEIQYSDGTPRRRLQKVDLDADEIRFQLWGYYAEDRTPGTTQAGNVVLAQALLSSETLYVYYESEHSVPGSDSSVLSVPDEDLPLLRAYILWQAATKTMHDELASPNVTTVMLNMLSQTVDKASAAYQKLLLERQQSQQDSAISPTWYPSWEPTYGRIY